MVQLIQKCRWSSNRRALDLNWWHYIQKTFVPRSDKFECYIGVFFLQKLPEKSRKKKAVARKLMVHSSWQCLINSPILWQNSDDYSPPASPPLRPGPFRFFLIHVFLYWRHKNKLVKDIASHFKRSLPRLLCEVDTAWEKRVKCFWTNLVVISLLYILYLCFYFRFVSFVLSPTKRISKISYSWSWSYDVNWFARKPFLNVFISLPYRRTHSIYLRHVNITSPSMHTMTILGSLSKQKPFGALSFFPARQISSIGRDKNCDCIGKALIQHNSAFCPASVAFHFRLNLEKKIG